MVPKIHRSGRSFKGVTAYLSHDQGQAATNERVAWTMTGNLRTDDVEKASRIMAFTALHAEEIKQHNGTSTAGRKSSGKPVSHHSLSWGQDENPNEQHMKATALDYIKSQGAEEHQYYIIAHNETEHKHVHIVINQVHPKTGKLLDTGYNKDRASSWALTYEKEHGVLCQQRLENEKIRKEVTLAFKQSDNGKSFVQALNDKGFQLAKGRRGNAFVVVDEKGDIQKLSRQLDIAENGKLKTAAIQNKLADLDRDQIADAEELARHIREQAQKRLEENQLEEEAKIKEIESKRKRARYDRKQEKEERYQRHDEARARGRKRAEKLAQKTKDKPKIWDRDKAGQRSQERIDKAGIEAEKQRLENLKKQSSRTDQSSATGGARPAQKAPPRKLASHAQILDRQRELESREDRQREQLDKTLDQAYPRKDVEEKLKDSLRQVGKHNNWFGRMTGRHQKALEEASNYRKTLNTIIQRENEQRGALANKIEADRQKHYAQEQDNRPVPDQRLDKTFNATGNGDRDARAEAKAKELDEKRRDQSKKDRDRGGYER